MYSACLFLQVPAARAAILWVLGEYSERVPKVAPDVLRKMAKNFTQEETEVKMQILNLATKLVLVNPEQTELLAQVKYQTSKVVLSFHIPILKLYFFLFSMCSIWPNTTRITT